MSDEELSLMEAGRKAETKTSFFGTKKPDWDSACQSYEQAANTFKKNKRFEQAIAAYLKVAECQKNLDSIYMAAKALENAAVIYQQSLNKPDLAAETFKKTSDYYLAHGTSDRAADCLEKAAKAMESVNIETSLAYYDEALSMIESEDRPRAGVDVFKRAISFATKSRRYDNAISSSKRLLDLYVKLEQKHYISKQALTNVLLPLLKNDEMAARQAFESQVSIPGFMNSDEGRTAEKILEVFQTGDEEALESILKSAAIRYLDNEVAKAASSLKVPPGRANQKAGPSKLVEKPVSEDVKDLQAQVEDEGFL